MTKGRRINENYTFVQAYNLCCKAQKAEKSDYIRALNLYRQAISLIDSILERFPSSDLAKLFMLNNQKELAIAIVGEAADLAERIENPEMRSRILSSIALRYADIGEFERALTLSVYFPDRMDQIRLLNI